MTRYVRLEDLEEILLRIEKKLDGLIGKPEDEEMEANREQTEKP